MLSIETIVTINAKVIVDREIHSSIISANTHFKEYHLRLWTKYSVDDYVGQYELADIIGKLVALLFYVHGKHLRSCRDGQLT